MRPAYTGQAPVKRFIRQFLQCRKIVCAALPVIKGVLERNYICCMRGTALCASGGLADVAGSLPAALSKNSEIDCRVVMPLYRSVTPAVRNKMTYLKDITVEVGWRKQYCGIYTIRWAK